MSRLLLETDHTLTIETALVQETVLVEQLLLTHLSVPITADNGFGEMVQVEQPRPADWVAGEDATARVLEAVGALRLLNGTPVEGSAEGLAIYARARKWFGGARAVGAQLDCRRFPDGVQRLRLVPMGAYPEGTPSVEL